MGCKRLCAIGARLAFLVPLVLAAPRIATAQNVAPVATDSATTVVEGEVRHYLYLPASDPERDPLSYIATALPAHGTLEHCTGEGTGGEPQGAGTCSGLVVGVSVDTPLWAYTPAGGFTGVDSFTWQANDGALDSNVATLTITVAGNTPPVSADQGVSVVEGAVATFIYLNFTDPDYAQPFVFTLQTAPGHGTLEKPDGVGGRISFGQGTTSTYPYVYFTPFSGFTGTDAFVWFGSDGLATTSPATVTVTVTANAPPVARSEKRVVLTNQATTFPAAFTDPDVGQTRTLSLVTPAAHGTVEILGTTFRYTPTVGFTGQDHFDWSVSDGVATSAVVTCSLLVRTPTDRAGMVVLLVVNHLLLPEIAAEVARLKTDLEAEGYGAEIVSFPSGGTAQALWAELKLAYDTPGQFVAGAILIGQLPRAQNTTTNETTDVAFWNMSALGDTTRRDIWVSRFWALSRWGQELFAGDEVTLIKRALQANHDYRTGASRLSHQAFHYDDVGSWGSADNALAVWPTSSVPVHAIYAFRDTGELLNETSHGGEGSYDYYGVYPRVPVTTSSILEALAQVRFVANTSCSSGQLGGVVNHQLLTREGGNILSVGATTTTYVGAFEMLGSNGSDVALRGRLAAGDTWGSALVDNYSAFDDRFRAVFYGDLSLPAKVSPSNVAPTIDSFTVDTTVGPAPLTVHFSVAASDNDGSLSSYAWFPLGHYFGKVEPASVGASLTTYSHTYTLPHRYLARVQIQDDFKAVAWKTQEIVVGPQPGQPLRVNVGGLSTYTTNLFEQALKCYRPGADYTDGSSQLWLHDQELVPGTWGATGGKGEGYRDATFTGTSDPTLFRSFRYTASNAPSFTYTVPVSNGGYTLRLSFADQWSNAAGQRLIDVAVEGESFLTAYDPFAVAGAATVVSPSKHVSVSDGLLEFTVAPNASSPGPAFLNAFEVLPDGSFNHPPVAVAAGTPTSGPMPLMVTFDGSASSDPDGTLAGFAWQFGDGANGAGVGPSHTYPNPGVYSAVLTVTDSGGAIATDSITITVTDPANVLPNAVASASPTTGMAPVLIHFDASASTDSDGTLTSYTWAFGDGHTGAGPAADHLYSNAGTFTATLTVTDNRGGTDSDTLVVVVTPAPNLAPVAVASADPVNGWIPLTVDFVGADSSDQDGILVDYAWDFADGTVANGAETSHTFTAAGRYAVLLTVTDNDGASASTTIEIVAGAADNLPPSAEIIAAPSTGLAPLSVNFDGSGAYDADGSIVSHAWSFGDGATSSEVAPAHEFNLPGTYQVQLRVTDDDGAVANAWTVIRALDQNNAPPTAELLAEPTAGTAPLTVTLEAGGSSDSDGTVTAFAWDFGDGTAAVGHFQIHVFDDPGTYAVTLTVTDDGGASGSASVVITVHSAPETDGGDRPAGDPTPTSGPLWVEGTGCACHGRSSGNAGSGGGLGVWAAAWLLFGRRRRRALGWVAAALLIGSACSPPPAADAVSRLLAGSTSDAMRTLADPASPLAQRRALIAQLGDVAHPRAVEILMALGDAEAYTRADAVRALGARAPTPSVFEYLHGKLRAEDARLAVAAADALARHPGDTVAGALLAALRDNRRRKDGHGEMVCGAILGALGRLRQLDTGGRVAEELAAVDRPGWSPEYGSDVVSALRAIGAAEVAPALHAYADRLAAQRPDDPIAGPYLDTKIREARRVADDLQR